MTVAAGPREFDMFFPAIVARLTDPDLQVHHSSAEADTHSKLLISESLRLCHCAGLCIFCVAGQGIVI